MLELTKQKSSSAGLKQGLLIRLFIQQLCSEDTEQRLAVLGTPQAQSNVC